MVEHVGASTLPEYFRRAWRLLRPGGLFLNHGIAYGAGVQDRNQCLFLQKYVFPDGELVPVTEMLKPAEEAGFKIRDVESLREHYALPPEKRERRSVSGKIRAGDCVKIPDGRIARVREITAGRCRVRVRRVTSDTHQFLFFRTRELERVDCPKGWMSPAGYNHYLQVILAKMRERLTG
jgi:cyclopropane fatty-acyl-phospholipid synthase-like methyltransferase